MAGVDPRPHVADAPLPLKDGVVHGQDHAAGAGGLHNPQVGQLALGQNGALKAFQRVPRPGGHADGPLGGVGEHVRLRGGDVQPLEYPLDGGEVLGILLGLPQQGWVLRVVQKVPDLAAQGEGGYVFLGGDNIVVNNGGSGLHRVGHLVGDVALDHGRRVGGHNDPQHKHPGQGDGGCDDPNTSGKFFVRKKFHKLSSMEKSFGDTQPCSLADSAPAQPEARSPA